MTLLARSRWLAGCAVLVLGSCAYSHEFRLSTEATSELVTDSEVREVLAVVEDVAGRFGFEAVPNRRLARVQDSFRDAGYAYRPVVWYENTQSSALDGSKASVSLVVNLAQDHSDLRVILRDFDHVEATEFTMRVAEALESELAPVLGSDRIKVVSGAFGPLC